MIKLNRRNPRLANHNPLRSMTNSNAALSNHSGYTGHSNSSVPGLGSGAGFSVGRSSLEANKPTPTGHFISESGLMPVPFLNGSMSTLPINVDLGTLLDDIGHDYFAMQNEKVLYRLYRDMYFYDCIAGAAVDMVSELPFSEFSLGGINDKKVIQAFNHTIERLNIRTLLPEISVDYLVLGYFIASLLYDKNSKTFSDIMPHPIENVDIVSLPFYSQAPIIEVKFQESLIKLLSNTKSPRIQALRDKFGQEVIGKIQSGKLELDPLSTVYLPRRSFSHTEGTSYYKRILPIYLLEKNLFRGTLLESSRRQRGIIHLTVGDGEQWDPSPEDMDFITELFVNASADPLGAIIATRLGVSVDEVMSPSDLWRVTETWDQTNAMKFKALGINESMISGEANYNTMDNSLTLFIDHLRAYRDMITRKFFYNTLFPLISVINGYTINEKGKVHVGESLLQNNLEDTLAIIQDGSKLLIPTVHWSKQLKPEGDSNYFDILDRLTNAGVPVPLRVIAAAGGFNIHELLAQKDDDIQNREQVGEYFKKLTETQSKFAVKPQQDEEGGGGGFSGFSSDTGNNESLAQYLNDNDNLLKALASDAVVKPKPVKSSVLANSKLSSIRPSLSDRFQDTDPEIVGRTRTGKPKAIYNQNQAQHRANDLIIKAVRSHMKHGSSQLNSATMTDLTKK